MRHSISGTNYSSSHYHQCLNPIDSWKECLTNCDRQQKKKKKKTKGCLEHLPLGRLDSLNNNSSSNSLLLANSLNSSYLPLDSLSNLNSLNSRSSDSLSSNSSSLEALVNSNRRLAAKARLQLRYSAIQQRLPIQCNQLPTYLPLDRLVPLDVTKKKLLLLQSLLNNSIDL